MRSKQRAKVVAAAVAALFAGQSLRAATLTWDADGVTPVDGGSGNWDLTSSTWYNGTYQTWGNTPDNAIFDILNPSTVFVSAPINVASIQFNAAGWTLSGNDLSFGPTGGTLAVNNNTAGTNSISSPIVDRTNPTALSLSGSGIVNLGSVNTYSGGTTINGGTFAVVDNVNLGNIAGGVTFGGGILSALGTMSTARTMTINAGGGTLDVAAASILTSTGVIGGVGGLTVSGAGTVLTTAANTYNGTTINAGATLQLGDGTNNNGSVSGAINVAAGGTLVTRFGDSLTTSPVTISNNISGSGVLEQKGVHSRNGQDLIATDSVVVLTGNNTYGSTGVIGTRLTSGKLSIDSPARIGAGLIDFNGASISAAGGLRITNNAAFLNGSTNNIDNRFVAGENRAYLDIADTTGVFTLGFALSDDPGVANNADVLIKDGAGTLNVTAKQNNQNNPGVAPGGNPGTVIYAGTVKLFAGNDTLSVGALEMNTGTALLDLNGNNQQFAGLDGPFPLANLPYTPASITNSSATPVTLTITFGGASFLGGINDGAGTIAVVKDGTGAEELIGPSTYSGGTLIKGTGTIQADLDESLGALNGTLTIDNGKLENRADTRLNQTNSLVLNAARSVVIGSGGATLIASGGGVISFDRSTLSILGSMSGAGALNISPGAAPGGLNGHGVVVLAGSNTGYTGAITVSGLAVVQGDGPNTIRGGLIAANSNALGDTATGTIINTNGWLGFQDNVNVAEPVTLTSGAAQLVNGSIRNIGGNNTYSGTITANNNAVVLGADAGSLKLTQAISSGVAAGSDAVRVAGAGSFTISAPQTYAGVTRVVPLVSGVSGQNVQAGTLKLEGTATLASSLHSTGGGTINIDSSSNGAGATARSVGLQLGDATVNVTGNSANNTTDSFGDLYLGSSGGVAPFNVAYGPGEANVVITPGAGRTSTVGVGTLNRESVAGNIGRGVMINLKGPNFGQAAGSNVAQATVTGFGTGAGLQGGTGSVTGILPYATITDSVSGVTSIATTGANGLRPLSTSVTNDYNTGAATGGGVINDGNVRLTSGTTTLTGNAAINSLTLHGSGITVAGGGQTLRIGNHNNANALLSTGTGNFISASTVQFGSATGTTSNEGNIYVEGNLTISGAIALNGTQTILNLTKAGPGDLRLSGTNTFATTTANNGSIKILNGTLSFDNSANLGASTNRVSLHGGGLRLVGSQGTVSVPQQINLSLGNEGETDNRNSFIQVDAGSTLSTVGIKQNSSRAGGFTKKGPGDLRLVGGTGVDRTGNGLSYLAEGSLTFAGTDTANFSGLQGGGWLVTSPGTTVNIDSTSMNTTGHSRMGVLVLSGATLNVTGNSSGATEDQVVAVRFGPGASAINLNQGGTQNTSFRATNSTSGFNIREQGATVVVMGNALGTTQGGARVMVQAGGQTNIGSMVPYVLVDQTADNIDNPTSFAVLNAGGGTSATTNGYREVTSNVTSGITILGTFGAQPNTRLTATDNNAGTVNSLTLNGSGISAGAGTLRVISGGVLNIGGSNSIDATTLAFGAPFGTREGIIHTYTPLTVNSAITASLGLTKAGPGTLTLNGGNNWSGVTYSNGGTLLLNNSLGLATSSSSVNAIAGKVELASGGSRMIKTGTVSALNGGQINLQNNKMIVSGQSASSVSALVASGRNGGNWNGTGIVTGQSNAQPAQNTTTLAVAAANDVGKTTFGGQSVSNETLVMYTWNGDANLSGKVDADDYFAIDSNYNKSGTVTGFNKGDFNYDGVIDGDDYAAIDTGFAASQIGPPFAPGAPAGVTAVPEPASLSVLGLAAVGLLRRRRRSTR